MEKKPVPNQANSDEFSSQKPNRYNTEDSGATRHLDKTTVKVYITV